MSRGLNSFLPYKYLLVAFLILFSTSALSHSWYDQWCCSNYDCAPIEREKVEVTSEGYRITLTKEDHLMLRSWEGNPLEFFVPFDFPHLKMSQDSEYHACIVLGGTNNPFHMRCFYVPPAGS